MSAAYRVWVAIIPEEDGEPIDRVPAFAGPVSDRLPLPAAQELATVAKTLLSDPPVELLCLAEPADPAVRSDDAAYVCPHCGTDVLVLRRLVLESSVAPWMVGDDQPVWWFDSDDQPDEVRIYHEWISCPHCGIRLESRWIPPVEVGAG